MVSFTSVLLLAATASANVLPRDYPQLNTDLQKINTDTNTLTKSLNSWDGTVNGAVPIQNNFNAVDNDIKSTTTDAKNSQVVTSANAQKLIDYINNTLEPSTSKAITATINKKSQFTSAGLAGTVCNNLKTLQTDENALGSALLAKTPSDKKSAAQTAQNKVAADITRGVNAFC